MRSPIIRSDDGMMSLEIGDVKGDASLILSSGGASLAFAFSSLMRVSIGRPWDFAPLSFNDVNYECDGTVITCRGRGQSVAVTGEFRFEKDRLCCNGSWRALKDLDDASVALVLELEYDMRTERVTLPMSIYNDNPAVQKGKMVPHFARKEGESYMAEESRYPIPCANVEWEDKGMAKYLSLFTIPRKNVCAWSLGVHRLVPGRVQVLAASGVVSFNGLKDSNYGLKLRCVKTASGYHSLKSGATIEKTFVIRFDSPKHVGHGFRDIVRTGYAIFRPQTKPALSIAEVLRLKILALDERWTEFGGVAGFLVTMPDNIYSNPPHFLWGWTGQSFRMAYCSARVGVKEQKPELIERARKCATFFLKGSRTKTKGLHYNRYRVEDKQWLGEGGFKEERLSSRALGETFWNFSKLVLFFMKNGLDVPREWVDELRDAADFFSDRKHLLKNGIPPLMWFNDGKPADNSVSAAGTACVCAILGAYQVTQDEKYLKAAADMLETYWAIGGDRFDRPFAKATLDSGCEDKEAAIPFFIAAADLYDLTGKAHYRYWAEVSGDWLLTWVYFWPVELKAGSICAHYGFVTTGWPSVSVENQHLDVFFPAYEMYKFGIKTRNDIFTRMGRTVFDAWSHGISKGDGDWFFDRPGRQGEQFFQTRWCFDGRLGQYPETIKERFLRFGYTGETFGTQAWEGGYNPWDVSWIIVLVLEAALNFSDLNLGGKCDGK